MLIASPVVGGFLSRSGTKTFLAFACVRQYGNAQLYWNGYGRDATGRGGRDAEPHGSEGEVRFIHFILRVAVNFCSRSGVSRNCTRRGMLSQSRPQQLLVRLLLLSLGCFCFIAHFYSGLPPCGDTGIQREWAKVEVRHDAAGSFVYFLFVFFSGDGPVAIPIHRGWNWSQQACCRSGARIYLFSCARFLNRM